MAYTTPSTWSSAAVLTAAQLNEQVRDNITYLKTEQDTIKTPVVVFQNLGTGVNLAEQTATWTNTGLSVDITPRSANAIVNVSIVTGATTDNTSNTVGDLEYYLYYDLGVGGVRVTSLDRGLTQNIRDQDSHMLSYVLTNLTPDVSNTISLMYLFAADDAQDDTIYLSEDTWIQVVDLP